MKLQQFQKNDLQVVRKFLEFRKANPSVEKRVTLSWSNWGFGIEPLQSSVARLTRNGIRYIELHGNRYGQDLGYKTSEVQKILNDHGVKVSGICGMVSPNCELSSNMPHITQRSIDYFRRNIELCSALEGSYLLFGPGAVGRTQPYDGSEFFRAAEAIRILGADFQKAGVRAAIEPIRAAETSFCHTFAEAKRLIDLVDHPGVQHIAGDLYHMLAGEEHIGMTILQYGHMMTNLHLADSNRRALGRGILDLDIVLMALYVVGYNSDRCFCSAEPLGPGSDPYPQMWGNPDSEMLDDLVETTARYFFEREEEILGADIDDIEHRRG